MPINLIHQSSLKGSNTGFRDEGDKPLAFVTKTQRQVSLMTTDCNRKTVTVFDVLNLFAAT